MCGKNIPRKYRKHVGKILSAYESLHVKNERFENLKEYLTYLKTGVEDGWIQTNNKEYQAVLWMNENFAR